MKELEKFLKVLSDGMRTLAQGVEGLAVKVDELAKAKSTPPKPPLRKKTKTTPKGPPKKSPKSTAKQGTANDAVLAIIKRSKKGVDMATMKKKTGFDDKKIHNIIYKLKKKGLVENAGKGVYTKA